MEENARLQSKLAKYEKDKDNTPPQGEKKVNTAFTHAHNVSSC